MTPTKNGKHFIRVLRSFLGDKLSKGCNGMERVWEEGEGFGGAPYGGWGRESGDRITGWDETERSV